jgi:hypothetical protein
MLIHIISTDEDPGLRIESFAVINLRGVSTNKTIYFIAMQTYKELSKNAIAKLVNFKILIAIYKKTAGFIDRNFLELDSACLNL